MANNTFLVEVTFKKEVKWLFKIVLCQDLC